MLQPISREPGRSATSDRKHEIAQQRANLRARYQHTGSATRLLRSHSALVDQQLKLAWQRLAMPHSAALLAVGGYGRGELFPKSDVDLLILLPQPADDDLKRRLEELVGELWDLGLEVGHSVRTVAESLEQAEADVTVQTNLLEARLLRGDLALFRKFTQAIAQAIEPQDFCGKKLREQQLRHARFQDSAYNLEPNVKESPGGLRDLQNVLWISRSANLGNDWRDLVREAIITSAEARQLKRDLQLLQTLRIRLHYLAGRREDRLLFDYQTALAAELGFRDGPTRLASEQLMQRYYRVAKSVSQITAIVLQNLRTRIFPAAVSEPRAINSRFRTRNDLLEARDEQLFEDQPGAILESFLLLQQHPDLQGMSATTLRALWRARRRIDKAFCRDPLNRALFMAILRQPAGITRELRRMHQYGILGRYIPAFGRVVGQMQHDLFHMYTVDEHILKVLRNLRRFTVPDFNHEFPLASRLIAAFERPETLYLATLFHDIAKGRGGDHSALGAADARRFCQEHGLAAADTALVEWLVQNHLVMSATAQKSDLSDLGVIAAFAKCVGDNRHLVALYLLTIADIRGTSPKVWNAWKAKLLEDLFRATRRHLSGSVATVDSEVAARQADALAKLRLYGFSDDAHIALWRELDTSYFARHEAQEIAWHTRLLHYRVRPAKAVVKARLSPIGEGLQVMIYAPDREKLFARICAFFESISYNIVEARIYTTHHGYALDSFQVLDAAQKPAHYRDLIAYVEHELAQRLADSGPLPPPVSPRLSRQVKHFPMAPQVSIEPHEKREYQVLSLVAADWPGLLSRVARILAEHEVSVHTARINTLGQRAEDIFLITGNNLQDADRLLRLKEVLLAQLKA
ncbi:MAG: [protein-PII] uridylyltransferase [Burkholderiales bacterium]|nr:[protein-PII] uridylyltransferase [Burkholderiales bacterium]